MNHTLFWLDLEMTGLNPEKDTILECAALITQDNLEVVCDGIEYVINQSAQDMQSMDPTVHAMHTHSRLLERVQQSPYNVQEVEAFLIQFFNNHCIPGKTLLCGNSIWVDRSFLKKYMPRFEALFYYRMIDVSTIKELIRRWTPTMPKFEKQKKHTALADIHESIAELSYYKKYLFRN